MNCKYCNKLFSRSKSDVKRGRIHYCSRQCYNSSRTKMSKERVNRILRLGRKQCQHCNVTKAIKLFGKNKQTIDGYHTYCKQCRYDIEKSWITNKMSKNRERFLEQRKSWHIKGKYGITIRQYKEMNNMQLGLCAICKSDNGARKLAIDHSHFDDKVRGLLCDKCNRGIGMFDDNPEYLKSAARYLGWSGSI